MDFATFIGLLSVWLAAIASPGPDVVQILRLGARARADGVACAIGIMIGNSVWILASLFGLSALVNTHPIILTFMKIIGGSYLLWIGINAFKSNGAELVTTASGMKANALRLGIFTNLSNPKALIFFGAVFAQFVQPEMSYLVSIFIAATLILAGLAWFVSVALAVQKASGFLQRNSGIIEKLCGLVFVVLALVMLYGGFHELTLNSS